jgi:hypothetical protein
MAKKDKKDQGAPLDLSARIGSRPVSDKEQAAPLPAPPEPVAPQRHDGPLPPRRDGARPTMIGMDEPTPPPLVLPPSPIEAAEDQTRVAIPSLRTPPGPGEVDIVATPLPTPDDWHRFEIALRRVRGVTQLRPEYYRHGVAKMRVMWEGQERLAHALRAGIAGYRIRVIGEDRSTIQLLVSSENDERRPG